MYTGTPKGDHKPINKNGMYNENFGGSQKSKINHEMTDFGTGIQTKEADKIFKLSKSLVDQKENEILSQARTPMHSSGQAAPKGKRGNSPATGALAGGAEVAKNSESKLNHQGSLANTLEDSFQKLYSKELDLDEDEVPLILHELNDSAIHFISKDQWDRALSLLQKAQTLLDRLMFQLNSCDRFLIQCTMHNMALCFQKMGAIEECSLCLDACLTQINQPNMQKLYKANPALKLKKLKYECKIHMQVCALLSQLNRHQEALCHAKQSVQISQFMMLDLLELCEVYNQKVVKAKLREQQAQEYISRGEVAAETFQNLFLEQADMTLKEIQNKLNKTDLIYFDEKVSMLERTAHKYYPIIQEACRRMVKHKDINSKSATFDPKHKPSAWVENKLKELRTPETDKKLSPDINMRVLLGYLNQSEWMYLLNIGNIMQITPLTIHDLVSTPGIEIELARDSVIEKLSFLAVSYFCVSTELRFLVNLKDNPNVDPQQIKSESEYWHGKALELSCTFLPSESPLVSHILSSYTKHHAPVKQAISEERAEQDDAMNLKVIRPLNGIDQAKQQPLVRANRHMHIALSPLQLSPNNYLTKKKKTEIAGKLIKQVQASHSTNAIKLTKQNTEPVEKQQPLQTSLPQTSKKPEEVAKASTRDVSREKKQQEASAKLDTALKQQPKDVPAETTQPPAAAKKPQETLTKSKSRELIKEQIKELIAKDGEQEPSTILSDKDSMIQTQKLEQMELLKQLIGLENITDLSLLYNQDEDTLKSFENELRQAKIDMKTIQLEKAKLLIDKQRQQLTVKNPPPPQKQPTPKSETNKAIQFLKDTPIDNKMLKAEPTVQQVQHQVTSQQTQSHTIITGQERKRPKTSENQMTSQPSRGVPGIQLSSKQFVPNGSQQQKLEMSPNEGKFKSSLNTHHDTLDPADLARNQNSMLSNNNMSSDKLISHTTSQQQLQGQAQSQQLPRPYTQQNFYESRQQNGHHNQSHQMLRPPASAHVSSSVTSGLTSQNSGKQKLVKNRAELVRHETLQPEQIRYGSNQRGQKVETMLASHVAQEAQYHTISGDNHGSSNLKQDTNRHQSTLEMTRTNQERSKYNPQLARPELKLPLERQVQSTREHGYNTVTQTHVTPKTRQSAIVSNQHTIESNASSKNTRQSDSQQTRYKNNNQILSTTERQPSTGTTTQHRSVQQVVPGPHHHQGEMLSGKRQSLNSNAAGSQKRPEHIGSHRSSNDRNVYIKHQLRQNQSASGSRERQEKLAQRQSQEQQIARAQQNQHQNQHMKSHGPADQSHHLVSHHTTKNSPHKDLTVQRLQHLEIQPSLQGKMTKPARTNVQTPTQKAHPLYINKAPNQNMIQNFQSAANERAHSGEPPSQQKPLQTINGQTMGTQKTGSKPNSQTKERSKQQATVLRTDPGRGTSGKKRQQDVIPIEKLNEIQKRFNQGKHGYNLQNQGELTGNQMGKTKTSASQQKSRNDGLNGISKTMGQVVAGGPSAGGVLNSHRGSVKANQTFHDDINQMSHLQMQIQQKLGSMQPKPQSHKMKIKTTKSQEKNYISSGQIQTHRSNKLQLNMKAVHTGGGQTFSARPGAIHSVRNINDKQKISFVGPNSSQKFFIDNSQLNLQNLQGNFNTYSLNSLEGTGQDIKMPGTGFPSTPNIQSARGSVNNGQQPLTSARSINSMTHSSQQHPGVGSNKAITIKKMTEAQATQQQRQENSYELLQRQRRDQNSAR